MTESLQYCEYYTFLPSSVISCTILDNFYVEKPIWMVDLGDKRKISGVIVVTWQGKGQGQYDTSTYPPFLLLGNTGGQNHGCKVAGIESKQYILVHILKTTRLKAALTLRNARFKVVVKPWKFVMENVMVSPPNGSMRTLCTGILYPITLHDGFVRVAYSPRGVCMCCLFTCVCLQITR